MPLMMMMFVFYMYKTPYRDAHGIIWHGIIYYALLCLNYVSIYCLCLYIMNH